MIKKFFVIFLIFLLTACFSDEPGLQCLNSFKSSLKDPDSGKVLTFEAPLLTYSATNSYGARTQAKALCKLEDKKWTRDSHAETMAILELVRKKIDDSNECLLSKSNANCAGDSLALNLASKLKKDIDLEKLQREAAIELGF
jgi:hypothetical protein